MKREREPCLTPPTTTTVAHSVYMQLDPLHVSFCRLEIWLFLAYQMFHLHMSSLRARFFL